MKDKTSEMWSLIEKRFLSKINVSTLCDMKDEIVKKEKKEDKGLVYEGQRTPRLKMQGDFRRYLTER